MSIETWASIPDWPGYEASDCGRVRSIDREIVRRDGRVERRKGRILSQSKGTDDYLCVRLSSPGFSRGPHVGRLVLLAFRGEPEQGMQASHNDGDKKNNRLSNLRWDTCAGNDADKDRHGTRLRGERHGRARIGRSDVAAIRASELSYAEIARQYGLHETHVSRICRGLAWAGEATA